MDVTLLLIAAGLFAGAFGALLGLGGGLLLVPLMTLGFGVPFRDAVGISLVAVITTSSAGAATYLQRRTANLRLGMTLELFTAIGALFGGLLAFAVPERFLSALFALMLAYTSVSMIRSGRGDEPAALPDEPPDPDDGAAAEPTHIESLSGPGYQVRRLPLGLALSTFAGVVSALLGVGGGTVKVPAMHLVMGVPLRVATNTSTLMIGITASASAVLYLLRGAIDPLVAGPVVVGVFGGAAAASRLAHHVPVHVLRFLFVVVLAYIALEMAARAFGTAIVTLPGD